jgi:hypothetical protein
VFVEAVKAQEHRFLPPTPQGVVEERTTVETTS